ncbi:MAG: c-type cytochrome [Gammaproteobacteria bacterium]|nr:c-type cytochrome [Gammaproteobacteria bacterium]
MCGLHNRGGDTDMSAEATAARIAPVAMLNTGAAIAAPAPVAAAAPAAARSGEDVYKGACFACHGTGAAGAPKMGDTAAWEPRIAKGMDALLQSALNGVPGTGMTPKGTCATCSSDELKAAVEYMTSNSK